MKVLVFGRDGQLGSALRVLSPESSNSLFFARSDLDFFDTDSIRATINYHVPDLVINAAAYTSVDLAEKESSVAFKINAEAPAIIASACNDIGARVIHFSTDYVFDGEAETPYSEKELVNPLGVYGQSKLAGEEAIAAETDSYIVIRTAWLYSLVGENFLKTMLRLAKSEKEMRVFSDQFGCPTYAYDLAKATWSIVAQLKKKEEFSAGIYHAVNSGVASWHEFAQEIFRALGRTDMVIHPITTGEYPTLAKRPFFTALSCNQIKKNFGVTLPNWRNAVSRCLHEAE